MLTFFVQLQNYTYYFNSVLDAIIFHFYLPYIDIVLFFATFICR